MFISSCTVVVPFIAFNFVGASQRAPPHYRSASGESWTRNNLEAEVERKPPSTGELERKRHSSQKSEKATIIRNQVSAPSGSSETGLLIPVQFRPERRSLTDISGKELLTRAPDRQSEGRGFESHYVW